VRPRRVGSRLLLLDCLGRLHQSGHQEEAEADNDGDGQQEHSHEIFLSLRVSFERDDEWQPTVQQFPRAAFTIGGLVPHTIGKPPRRACRASAGAHWPVAGLRSYGTRASDTIASEQGTIEVEPHELALRLLGALLHGMRAI
jgi:hypothetical protein